MYYAIKNCGISHCDIVDNSRNNRYQFAIRSVSSRVRSRSKRARDKKHQNRRKICKLNKNKKPKRARPRARFFKVIASVRLAQPWFHPFIAVLSRKHIDTHNFDRREFDNLWDYCCINSIHTQPSD